MGIYAYTHICTCRWIDRQTDRQGLMLRCPGHCRVWSSLPGPARQTAGALSASSAASQRGARRPLPHGFQMKARGWINPTTCKVPSRLRLRERSRLPASTPASSSAHPDLLPESHHFWLLTSFQFVPFELEDAAWVRAHTSRVLTQLCFFFSLCGRSLCTGFSMGR